MSFWRSGEALHCQVDVFWSHVHSIWQTIRELYNGSRLGNRELPSRNILVHVITVIVQVHFTIFIAVNRWWTWNTCSCFGTKIIYRLRYRSRYRVRYWGRSIKTLFVHSKLFRYRWKTVDIGYDIQFRCSLYTRCVFDIEVFIRYRVPCRITISGYKNIKGKKFDIVHDICAISGNKDIDVFSSISKIWSI
jgi:hypothetical protein